MNENISADSLKYILAQPKGRKVIWDMLAICGLYRNPRVPSDSEGTSFNCGMMNVGQILYAECMSASPDLTAMMIKEQGNDDNTSERTAAAADTGKPNPGPEHSAGGPVSEPDNSGDYLGLGFDRSGH